MAISGVTENRAISIDNRVSNKIIIDTNVAIYLAKGDRSPWAAAFKPMIEGKIVAVAFATAAELLLTSRKSPTPKRTLSYWHERLKLLAILTPDIQTCEIWAEITADLKNSGFTRQDNDLWIAACAIRHGLPLVTNNKKDFTHIHRLELITP